MAHDPSALSQRDREFMALAIRMAERGLGTTAPNPAVGAVLVRDGGEIAGRGWTRSGGRPHAETEALGRAGDAARGATLYVTLEPCAHHGHTPPCTDALIAVGIARAVVGVIDPDARVAGRGIAVLRAAGIQVDEVHGPLRDACFWLQLGHIRRVMEQRPFIQLKIAVDGHGRVPLGGARVTGTIANAAVHLLRARADAILTGIGTLLTDDPELTCRLPGLGDRSPIRVVLDTHAQLLPASRLAQSATSVPVWWLTANAGAAPDGVSRVAVPVAKTGHLDLASALHLLSARGITRLLVEAGPRLAAAFLAANVLDEIMIITGAANLSDAVPTALPFNAAGNTAGLEALALGWTEVAAEPLGNDVLRRYRRKES